MEQYYKDYKGYPYEPVEPYHISQETISKIAKYIFFRLLKWLEDTQPETFQKIHPKPKQLVKGNWRTLLQNQLLLDLWHADFDNERLNKEESDSLDFFVKNHEWIANFMTEVLEATYPENELVAYTKRKLKENGVDPLSLKLLEEQLSKEEMTKPTAHKEKAFAVMDLVAKKIAADKAQEKVVNEERMRQWKISADEKAKHKQEMGLDVANELVRKLRSKSQTNQG